MTAGSKRYCSVSFAICLCASPTRYDKQFWCKMLLVTAASTSSVALHFTHFTLQRAWEFLMRLTFVIFSMQSDSLQAAVDGLPDGLSLLLRCLNSEGLGRLPGLLLPHVARLLCQTDEGT